MLPALVVIEESDDEVEVELDEDEPEESDIALELSCSTANSTRPEVGLIITSLIVPIDEPELPCTWLPCSLLARTAWLEERPMCELLELCIVEPSLLELPLKPDSPPAPVALVSLLDPDPDP